ncbi:hypothetical protein M9458_054733, partial [Cirrhinus mrigala]
MLTGDPLFPGDSDIDQLHLVISCFGEFCFVFVSLDSTCVRSSSSTLHRCSQIKLGWSLVDLVSRNNRTAIFLSRAKAVLAGLTPGHLTPRHREVFYRNPVFMGVSLPEPAERNPLESRSLKLSGLALDLAQVSAVFNTSECESVFHRCLQMDPDKRSQCADLPLHPYFTRDRFHVR